VQRKDIIGSIKQVTDVLRSPLTEQGLDELQTLSGIKGVAWRRVINTEGIHIQKRQGGVVEAFVDLKKAHKRLDIFCEESLDYELETFMWETTE